MATFTAIKASEAPSRPTPRTGPAVRIAQYDGYINGLERGQVGRLTLVRGETERGVVLRVHWAGKRAGKTVDVWSAAGAVYFKVI